MRAGLEEKSKGRKGRKGREEREEREGGREGGRKRREGRGGGEGEREGFHTYLEYRAGSSECHEDGGQDGELVVHVAGLVYVTGLEGDLGGGRYGWVGGKKAPRMMERGGGREGGRAYLQAAAAHTEGHGIHVDVWPRGAFLPGDLWRGGTGGREGGRCGLEGVEGRNAF